jgi:hypothetical protein
LIPIGAINLHCMRHRRGKESGRESGRERDRESGWDEGPRTGSHHGAAATAVVILSFRCGRMADSKTKDQPNFSLSVTKFVS